MTKVSFLIPSRNCEAYVADSLNSARYQSWQDIEIIAVDDGSLDRTPSIIEEIARKDPRVKFLRKHHSGLADSLNFGARHATGEWIARLDADDLSEPCRIERQLHAVGACKTTVLVGSGFTHIDAAGNAFGLAHYPSNDQSLRFNLAHLRRFFPHSSALIKATAFRAHGGYNTNFTKAQDWDLWFRLAEVGRIRCCAESLVSIRRHPAQVTNSTSGYPQLTYAVAAAVCSLLRADGCEDPSRSPGGGAWPEFLEWVHRSESTNWYRQIRTLVGRSRDGAESNANGLKAALLAVAAQVVGFGLPRKLAAEWRLSCVV